jgi:hypothetical protein
MGSTLKSDAVVCAIPVGCLKEKKALRNPRIGSDGSLHIPGIKFEPPLPTNKREVIEGIGQGSINKLVLVFEKRFWSDACFFGRINDKE